VATAARPVERQEEREPAGLEDVMIVELLEEEATPEAPAVERSGIAVTFRVGPGPKAVASRTELYAMLPPCRERALVLDRSVELCVRAAGSLRRRPYALPDACARGGWGASHRRD
jgi:hypothetical protein